MEELGRDLDVCVGAVEGLANELGQREELLASHLQITRERRGVSAVRELAEPALRDMSARQ